MKHNYKRTICIALLLILLGLIIYGITRAVTGRNFSTVISIDYERVTHTVNEPFSEIEISAVECDVRIILSPDGSTTVSSGESEYIRTYAAVEDGILKIERVDTRPWYLHIGIFFFDEDYHMTVSVPDTVYESVKIRTASGDISMDDTLSLKSLSLKTSSGDITSGAKPTDSYSAKTLSGDIEIVGGEKVAGRIVLETTSGEIEAERLFAGNTVGIDTTSGDIELDGVFAEKIVVSSTSGDIHAFMASAMQSLSLKNVSGDIVFASYESASLRAETTSGNIKGSIIDTMMLYNAKTTSGKIRIPPSDPNGGDCTLITVSGNIDIQDKQG